MPCIHKEKLKCSRLCCHLLSKAVIYGLQFLLTKSAAGVESLSSATVLARVAPAWCASCHEGPPGMALLSLDRYQ